MSSFIRIKDLPASTGVALSDTLLASSATTTYNLSISDLDKELRKKTVNTRSTSSESNYAFQTTDIDNIVVFNKLAVSTASLSKSVSDTANTGDTIDIVKTTDQALRISASSGVSIISVGNHTDLIEKNSYSQLIKINDNQWLLTGYLFTAPSGTFTEPF